jgi:hypothetical protein
MLAEKLRSELAPEVYYEILTPRDVNAKLGANYTIIYNVGPPFKLFGNVYLPFKGITPTGIEDDYIVVLNSDLTVDWSTLVKVASRSRTEPFHQYFWDGYNQNFIVTCTEGGYIGYRRLSSDFKTLGSFNPLVSGYAYMPMLLRARAQRLETTADLEIMEHCMVG